MNKKLEKQANETLAKIRALTRHIRNVCDNCILLGEKLILSGEIDLGKQLIANGFIHDASKWRGIEWDSLISLSPESEEKIAKLKLKLAIHQHQSNNGHHVEYWNDIHKMPDVFLAEFCADSKARSEEFGTDLRVWVDNTATKRWNFNKNDEVYKKIMYFVDLLCEKPFVETK